MHISQGWQPEILNLVPSLAVLHCFLSLPDPATQGVVSMGKGRRAGFGSPPGLWQPEHADCFWALGPLLGCRNSGRFFPQEIA